MMMVEAQKIPLKHAIVGVAGLVGGALMVDKLMNTSESSLVGEMKTWLTIYEQFSVPLPKGVTDRKLLARARQLDQGIQLCFQRTACIHPNMFSDQAAYREKLYKLISTLEMISYTMKQVDSELANRLLNSIRNMETLAEILIV